MHRTLTVRPSVCSRQQHQHTPCRQLADSPLTPHRRSALPGVLPLRMVRCASHRWLSAKMSNSREPLDPSCSSIVLCGYVKRCRLLPKQVTARRAPPLSGWACDRMHASPAVSRMLGYGVSTALRRDRGEMATVGHPARATERRRRRQTCLRASIAAPMRTIKAPVDDRGVERRLDVGGPALVLLERAARGDSGLGYRS